jgi:hypothetical protein
LAELWARHLFETVQANGQKGFSRFNLWWKQKQQSVEIVGEWAGAVCLRQWVYGNRRQACPRYLEAGDKNLLRKVAVTHARLILAGQTSEVILSAAVATASHKDFEKRLSSLAKDRAGGDHGS